MKRLIIMNWKSLFSISKESESKTAAEVDWEKVAQKVLQSRTIDDKEEQDLVPDGEVVYQLSSRGRELSQVLLGMQRTHPHDAVSAYYRSRPLMLSLGISLEAVLASPMGKPGGHSDGRDIGVVCNKR